MSLTVPDRASVLSLVTPSLLMVAVRPVSVPIVLLMVSVGPEVSSVKLCPVPAVVSLPALIVRTLSVPVPLLSVTPLVLHVPPLAVASTHVVPSTEI